MIFSYDYYLSDQAIAEGEREMWIRTETADPNGCHDIGIQFAAFRAAKSGPRGAALVPRSIVLKYQLFTEPYHSTPPLVLLGTGGGGQGGFHSSKTSSRGGSSKTSGAGSSSKSAGGGRPLNGERVYLLEREGAGPDSTLKRFVIDTSAAPEDAKRFANYLYTKRLQIDVWDADSLMQIGSASLPLAVLARQQQTSVKASIELEIIASQGHVVVPEVGGGGGPVVSRPTVSGWLQGEFVFFSLLSYD